LQGLLVVYFHLQRYSGYAASNWQRSCPIFVEAESPPSPGKPRSGDIFVPTSLGGCLFPYFYKDIAATPLPLVPRVIYFYKDIAATPHSPAPGGCLFFLQRYSGYAAFTCTMGIYFYKDAAAPPHHSCSVLTEPCGH